MTPKKSPSSIAETANGHPRPRRTAARWSRHPALRPPPSPS